MNIKNDSGKLEPQSKLLLNIREAAQYTGIGINKLEEMTKEPTCNFVLYVGRKRLIKRTELEKYLIKAIEI